MPDLAERGPDLESLEQLLREAVPIPFGRRDLQRILAAVSEPRDCWQIVARSGAPMRLVCEALRLLLESGLCRAEEHRLTLTDRGRALVERERIAPTVDFRCLACDGRGVALQRLGELATVYAEICARRPAALQQYDQGFVTEATSIARVAHAWERGDLAGRDLLVIGDDDLVGIAAALTRAPRRVLVLDIDERLVDLIRRVRVEHDLPALDALPHDLREPLPEALAGAFDTFFSDPTESFEGFCTFVERGFVALRGPGSAGYFGLTRVESSLAKWQRIQRFLLDRGAVITDLVDRFSHYVNWDYVETMRAWAWLPVPRPPRDVWYTSSLFRVELLEPTSAANRRTEGNIFDDEEAATT